MADLREAAIRAQFRSGQIRLARGVGGGSQPVGSAYVDLFWTPIVGSSVTAFLRWAQLRLRTPLDQWVSTSFEMVDAAEICEALGRLNPGKACATVVRAVVFHCADLVDRGGLDVIEVRTALQTLSPQRVEQLSGHLRERHNEMMMEAVR